MCDVCEYVCVGGSGGGKGGWVSGGVAENWCYQYLTNPSSIFMADNRTDLQVCHVSGRVFITY